MYYRRKGTKFKINVYHNAMWYLIKMKVFYMTFVAFLDKLKKIIDCDQDHNLKNKTIQQTISAYVYYVINIEEYDYASNDKDKIYTNAAKIKLVKRFKNDLDELKREETSGTIDKIWGISKFFEIKSIELFDANKINANIEEKFNINQSENNVAKDKTADININDEKNTELSRNRLFNKNIKQVLYSHTDLPDVIAELVAEYSYSNEIIDKLQSLITADNILSRFFWTKEAKSNPTIATLILQTDALRDQYYTLSGDEISLFSGLTEIAKSHPDTALFILQTDKIRERLFTAAKDKITIDYVLKDIKNAHPTSEEVQKVCEELLTQAPKSRP